LKKKRASQVSKERLKRLLTLIVLYGVMSLTALFVFLIRPGMTGHPQADFPELVYGQAEKPYVARAALPLTVRLISAATPHVFKNFCYRQLTGRRIVESFRWHDEYLYEYALATLLMFLCLVGFAFTLKGLTEYYYDLSPILNDLGPMIGLALLPLFFRYYSYLYDPGTLLLFTLALLLMVKRPFVWFTAGFALAALNKETSILLIVLYVCHQKITTGRIPAVRTIVLALIWLFVRAALTYAFRDNTGGYVENHFREHNIWLLTKFPMAMRYTLAVVVVFFLFIRCEWRDKPKFLRVGLAVTLLPLLVAGMFFGFVDELRGYYEAFPFLYLLMIPTMFKFLSKTST
jgi:hypothetical protein